MLVTWMLVQTIPNQIFLNIFEFSLFMVFGKNSFGLYLFGHLVLAYLQLVPNVLINKGVVTSRCPLFKMNDETDV